MRTGIDVLEEENFEPLRGKQVELITNQTGMDARGRRTIDLLAKADGLKLVALLSPEHGIAGNLEEKVSSGRDATTGLVIYSLYGETRRPTDEMLRGVDALVFDVQDAGVRFFTYVTTMGYAMEEAARHRISFYVLDRPNPQGGERIEGPMLDRDRLSFVGYFPMPVMYGMTLGELARMFNGEEKLGTDLHVIAMKGWKRNETFETTGVAWIAPSPNLPSLDALWSYPGIEILQAGGVSVGRGTDRPFGWVGAPWIKGDELTRNLNARKIPGAEFAPARFTPRSDPYQGQNCDGVSIEITERRIFRPMRTGMEIAEALDEMYRPHFSVDKMIELVGSKSTIERLKRGDATADIAMSWKDELAAFRKMRAKYLLYH